MDTREIKKLIEQGESDTLEFKKSTANWRGIVESVCAFANSGGGMLMVGIKDNGEVIGQQISDDTLKYIVNGIALNIEPKVYPLVRKIEYEGRNLVSIEMEESPVKPHIAFGRFYLRLGPTNQKGSQEEYRAMLSQKLNGYGFDHILHEKATLDDIDTEELYKFIERGNQQRSLNANLQEPADVLLEKLGLLREKKLTNSAILLFGKEPAKYFLGHFENKCGVLNEKSGYHEFLSEKEFSGNLIQNYHDTYTFVLKHIDRTLSKDVPERREVWEYPLFAIQEAIVNMIVHRDYRINIKNYVEMRPDKIEFKNPGHLFKPVITLDKLKKPHPSRPGNKLIAQCFYWLKLFENWGSGTITMIETMKKMELPEPEFFYEDGLFAIVLRNK